MRIFIITMEDPVYTLPFIKEIIINRQKEIVGLAVSKGGRFTIGKKRSKFLYLISLLLIMGIKHFCRYSFITISFKIKKKLSKYIRFIKNPSVLKFAEQKGIKTYSIDNPNKNEFVKILKEMDLDVIINQSQSIIKKKLLQIPKIGIINRHNALLPKNRGRLTPFWVLYKKEKETGVSIHFVEEGIDSGDIIVQERFLIEKKDNFNTIVKKNYELAPVAILKALDILKKGDYELIKNDDQKSTYNTIPTLNHAILYRISRIKKLWN